MTAYQAKVNCEKEDSRRSRCMRDKQAGRQAASRQDHLVGPGRLPCCRDRGRSVAARNNKESWAREEAGKGDREGRGEGGGEFT